MTKMNVSRECISYTLNEKSEHSVEMMQERTGSKLLVQDLKNP